jgi:gliding motility-associated-like protein
MRFTILFACFWVIFTPLRTLGQDTVFMYNNPVISQSGSTLDIEIKVQGFENISAYQFGLEWDTSFLVFDTISYTGLPGLTIGNFGMNNIDNGELTASWTTNFLNLGSLPNGATLFTIRLYNKALCKELSALSKLDTLDAFCVRMDSLNIVVLPIVFTGAEILSYCPPILDSLTVVDTPCEGLGLGSIQIHISEGLPPFEVSWTTGASGFLLDSLESAYYGFILTDSVGSIIQLDSVFVGEGTPFQIQIGSDTILCDGSDYLIEIEDWEEVVSTSWYQNDINLGQEGALELLVMESGMYVVVAFNESGCIASDSVEILIQQSMAPLLQVAKQNICPGDSTTLSVSGGDNYDWINGLEYLTIINGQYAIAYPAEPTVFSVVVSDDCRQDTLSVEIGIVENATYTTSDILINEGEEVTLEAFNAQTYQWVDCDGGITLGGSSTLSLMPTQTSTYCIVMLDSAGCRRTGEIVVEVLGIQATNVITPNNDGKNDLLVFRNLSNYGNNTLTVFNRWGNTVYEAVNYQNDWGGISGGRLLPSGVYYYILRFQDFEIKSSLTILHE